MKSGGQVILLVLIIGCGSGIVGSCFLALGLLIQSQELLKWGAGLLLIAGICGVYLLVLAKDCLFEMEETREMLREKGSRK